MSGGESHTIPRFATRFRFMIATIAAATRNRNPITRSVVADKGATSITLRFLETPEEWIRPKARRAGIQ